MFGNEIELVFTNEGYAMNTKGKYFHANLLTLAVFAALYPTIGSATNIMYQNGGEHNINDLRDCHEFCVHGIIGARHTGTPHEHDYQETNLS